MFFLIFMLFSDNNHEGAIEFWGRDSVTVNARANNLKRVAIIADTESNRLDFDEYNLKLHETLNWDQFDSLFLSFPLSEMRASDLVSIEGVGCFGKDIKTYHHGDSKHDGANIDQLDCHHNCQGQMRHKRFAYRIQQEFGSKVVGWFEVKPVSASGVPIAALSLRGKIKRVFDLLSPKSLRNLFGLLRIDLRWEPLEC